MIQSSLDVVETFLGDELTLGGIQLLEQAPEEQIYHLAQMFDTAWDHWRSARLSHQQIPINPLYLRDSFRDDNIVKKSQYYKLALYFNQVGVPDPVDASISARLILWAAINVIDIEGLRIEMVGGLLRLLEIAPFIRAGAMELVPYEQLLLSTEVQSLARKNHSEFEQNASVSGTYEDLVSRCYYGGTAACTAASFWPLTGTPELAERMRQQMAVLQLKSHAPDIVMQHAVARFELPSAANLPIEDLLRLRASEDAFFEFRRTFGLAMLEATQMFENSGDFAAQELLKERLTPASKACVNTAKTIDPGEGFFVPTGAELTTNSIGWFANMPIDSMLPAKIAALGVGWLGYHLLQRMSQSNKVARAASAVYGALLEKRST